MCEYEPEHCTNADNRYEGEGVVSLSTKMILYESNETTYKCFSTGQSWIYSVQRRRASAPANDRNIHITGVIMTNQHGSIIRSAYI